MTVRTRRIAGLDGIELKDATFSARTFPPHFHEAWSLGFVRSGVESMRIGADDLVVPSGTIVVLPPGEVHAHAAFGGAPWRYQTAYVSPDLVRARQQALGLADDAVPSILSDTSLAQKLAALHDGASVGILARVSAAVDALFARHGRSAAPTRDRAAGRVLCEAADLLRSAHEKISLATLAAKFRQDPQRFARAFRRRYGLTPAAFQIVHRINRARTLLSTGAPIAEAAALTGFYDQSHLVRHFRRYTGTTPSDYRRGDGAPR